MADTHFAVRPGSPAVPFRVAFLFSAVALATVAASVPNKNQYTPPPKGAAAKAVPARPGGRAAAPMVRNGMGPAHSVARTASGAEIHRGPSGNLMAVHAPNGAMITHSPSGVRSFEVRRPDGSMVVGHGSGGYIQRPFMSGGHPYVQRTFVHDGRTYARAYRPWGYGGHEYNFYARDHYYHPGYYRWAYAPYAHPYPYRWGWEGRPWYGHYGAYYQPYPVYESPTFWLADFMVAAVLENAYLESHPGMAKFSLYQPLYFSAALGHHFTVSRTLMMGELAGVGNGAMPPEAKQALAEEVRREMERSANEAQNPGQETVPAIFTDNGPRTFLVHASGLSAVDGAGQECSLRSGDVVSLVMKPSPAVDFAPVRVLASQDPALPNGSVIQMKTADLVEMGNEMSANLDQGLQKLQAKGDGSADGMPMAPEELRGGNDAPYAKDLQPDTGAASSFAQTLSETDQAEKDAIAQEALAEAAEKMARVRMIQIGMTTDQVLGFMGNPDSTESKALGTTKIFHYGNSAVTIVLGTVYYVSAKP